MKNLLGILLIVVGLIGLPQGLAPGFFHGIYGSLALSQGPEVSQQVQALLDEQTEASAPWHEDKTLVQVPAHKLKILVQYGSVLQRIYDARRGDGVISQGVVLSQSLILIIVGVAIFKSGLGIRKTSNNAVEDMRDSPAPPQG